MSDRKEYKQKWYIQHKDKVLERSKKYRENNPGYAKQWRQDNAERLKIKCYQYIKNKRKTDLKFNLNDKVSSAIRESLKGNKSGRHWETLV